MPGGMHMTAALDMAEVQHVWGTFDTLRDHLFDQFQDVPFDPETGLSLEELQQEVGHPILP